VPVLEIVLVVPVLLVVSVPVELLVEPVLSLVFWVSAV